MKILFDHPNPFLLAHGGFQIQIEQTKKALEEIGVKVEWLRWWDASQSGDVIHYFGRPSAAYLEFAHQKKLKVVMSELLTGLGSRSARARKAQKFLMKFSSKALPKAFTARLSWDAYRMADAIIALTPWEKQLMIEMFDAPEERVHFIPNGVEEVFFAKPETGNLKPERGRWLVCTATITERKRVQELAEAAILAQTPVWIIGAPYAKSDPYYLRFLDLVEQSGGIVRYEGGISDRTQMAEIYKSARGFVLLSTMESLSLSALEAAASGCPLLLSDLPWAKSTFQQHASYCSLEGGARTASVLKAFYDSASGKALPEAPKRWSEVAEMLEKIYRF